MSQETVDSIRKLLAKNAGGITRDAVYREAEGANSKADIAMAIKELKDSGEMIEMGSGARTFFVPVCQDSAEKSSERPKPEPAPTTTTPAKPSTAGQVTEYLRQQGEEDPERWIPNTELMRICSDGSLQGNARVSQALTNLKANGKIEPKPGERGYYRWKQAQVLPTRLPVLPAVGDVTAAKLESPPAPKVEEQAAPLVPLIEKTQFAEQLHKYEVDAANDFIAKCQLLIATGSDEIRIACAIAQGRLEMVQGIIERYELEAV